MKKGRQCERKVIYMFKRVRFRCKKGMEFVQVAILVALAVALGLIFKTEITDFVNKTFEGLSDFN